MALAGFPPTPSFKPGPDHRTPPGTVLPSPDSLSKNPLSGQVIPEAPLPGQKAGELVWPLVFPLGPAGTVPLRGTGSGGKLGGPEQVHT